jgi:hypothetical protein
MSSITGYTGYTFTSPPTLSFAFSILVSTTLAAAVSLLGRGDECEEGGGERREKGETGGERGGVERRGWLP